MIIRAARALLKKATTHFLSKLHPKPKHPPAPEMAVDTGRSPPALCDTLFPGIMWLLPSPQWWKTSPERLPGREIAKLYAKDIPNYVPIKDRVWALHQASLFELLDKCGGWQAYLLPVYDCDAPVADATIMDVLLTETEDPKGLSYWKALLVDHREVSSATINDIADFAQEYPDIWRKHSEGLKWLDKFFSRHYRPLNDKGG